MKIASGTHGLSLAPLANASTPPGLLVADELPSVE
jgi:hypothetical protein